MTEPIRLQKYISAAGRASRREAERLMAAGRVQVNGVVVTELGTKVTPGSDVIAVDGAVIEEAAARWVAFHKPSGTLTTRHDPHGGRTIYDALPGELGALRYLGRLDRDTEGLLLLTNQGDLAHRLQHPSSEIERTYLARVAGRVEPSTLHELMSGVALEDGLARARAASLREVGAAESVIELTLTEGRKREVRRMLYAVGHEVIELTRVRFGPIVLEGLARGAWRDLSAEEVADLATAVAGSDDAAEANEPEGETGNE